MKPLSEVSAPNDAGSLLKKPVHEQKNHTMNRTADRSNHSTIDSTATGPDNPQVDNRQSKEPIKGSQAEADASLVAPPQDAHGQTSTDTKKKPR